MLGLLVAFGSGFLLLIEPLEAGGGSLREILRQAFDDIPTDIQHGTADHQGVIVVRRCLSSTTTSR